MPLGDVTYQNAALDAVVASWPSSGAKYHLYSGDPAQAALLSDVELTSDGGYAPVTFSPSGWASASGGSKTTTAAVSFGTSTGAYSDVATYWAVVDSSGRIVFSDDLDGQEVEVDDTGTTVAFTPTLNFSTAG